MEVIRVWKHKDGGHRMRLEMSLKEYELLVVAGLRQYVKERRLKVAVVPVAEADKAGLVRKGMKTVELSKGEGLWLVEKAVNQVLKERIARERARRKAEKSCTTRTRSAGTR